MGCGASVDKRAKEGRSSKRGKRLIIQQEQLPPPVHADPATIDDAIVTPTGTMREEPDQPPEGVHLPPGRYALRIETAPPTSRSRENAGLAVTPVGKQAEEFRFFCPVCMMFFRSILETECCRQSICMFCLSEHVNKRAHAKGIETTPVEGIYRKPMLPAGIPCPQCAQVQKARAQMMRTLEGADDVKVPYATSPGTSQHLEEISSRREFSSGSQSPLKIGDDFPTMARKMLPFEVVPLRLDELEEEGELAAPRTPEVAPRPPEGMAAFSRNESLSASTGRPPASSAVLGSNTADAQEGVGDGSAGEAPGESTAAAGAGEATTGLAPGGLVEFQEGVRAGEATHGDGSEAAEADGAMTWASDEGELPAEAATDVVTPAGGERAMAAEGEMEVVGDAGGLAKAADISVLATYLSAGLGGAESEEREER